MGHSSVNSAASSPQFDIAVIGCGIVGAACAAQLTREGARVVVLERGPIGGGATAAGMGHVVVMDDSPAQLALTSYSRGLWQELVPHLPARAECEICGTLWIAADEEEMAAVQRKQAVLREAGVATKVLSAAELSREEPNLRRGLAGGLLVPDDLVVYPPSVAEFLLQQATAGGAEYRTGAGAAGTRRRQRVSARWNDHSRGPGGQCHGQLGTNPVSRIACAAAQRPPGNYRPVPRVRSSPAD